MSRQKKATKEKATPVAAPRNFRAVPCAPHRPRTLDQLAGGVKATPLGLDMVERNPPGAVPVLGLLYGD